MPPTTEKVLFKLISVTCPIKAIYNKIWTTIYTLAFSKGSFSHLCSFRWRSGSRTGAPSRRRTRGRTLSCVQWFQKRQQPAVSSDCWSRGGCWHLQVCRASYPTAAAALWALPCALPQWPWPVMAAIAAAAAVAAALAQQAGALLYPPSPAQGQCRACRAPLQLTASSASPCPPYSVVSPPAFPPIPCPWLARWLATCRNFLPATWAPLLLSLTHGPMAKNPWTRKFWNDALLEFLFPLDMFWLFPWLSLSLFAFAQSLSSVCVKFCSSLRISVALAPCTRKKTKTCTSSSNNDKLAVERFCTKYSYRTLLQRIRKTHSEVITEGSFRFLINKALDLSVKKITIWTGAQRIWLLHTRKALPLEKRHIVYSRKYGIGDRKCKVMVPFWILLLFDCVG